jgi:hypothetical protein
MFFPLLVVNSNGAFGRGRKEEGPAEQADTTNLEDIEDDAAQRAEVQQALPQSRCPTALRKIAGRSRGSVEW